MRIGINLFGESKLRSGVGRYTFEVLGNLATRDSSNEYYIFIPEDTFPSFYIDNPRFHYVRIWLPSYNVVFRRVFEQFFLPFKMLGYRLDIVPSTNTIAPILLGKKNIVTVHDIARWQAKGTGSFINVEFLKILSRLSMSVSAKVLTVSQFSKSQLHGVLHIPEDKIVTIYNAINQKVFYRRTDEDIAKVKQKFNLQKDYIFMHATLETRKNHINLIRAFNKLKAETDLDLVLVGKSGYGSESVFEEIESLGLKNRVHVLGFLDDSEMVPLLSGASVFAFPSLYEGAGLPPLEAMACGVPVVTSNIEVIKDYAGDAAIFANPEDVDDIAHSLKLLYTDKKIRDELVQKGYEHIRKFSWDSYIDKLLKVWNDVNSDKKNK